MHHNEKKSICYLFHLLTVLGCLGYSPCCWIQTDTLTRKEDAFDPKETVRCGWLRNCVIVVQFTTWHTRGNSSSMRAHARGRFPRSGSVHLRSDRALNLIGNSERGHPGAVAYWLLQGLIYRLLLKGEEGMQLAIQTKAKNSKKNKTKQTFVYGCQTVDVTIISYKSLSGLNFARYTGHYCSCMPSLPLWCL